MAAALTGEWGGEPDHSWLSAEGIISTGLAAIVILVAVQHRHLVRPAEGQARGRLTWGWGTALPNRPAAAGRGPGLRWDITQIHQPTAPFAQMVRPNSVPALWPPVLAPTPGGEAHGLSRHPPPPPLLPATLEEAASSLGTWVLPEHKEVALLIAAATQWLADYVVIGVGVIPRLRKHMYPSGISCHRQQGSAHVSVPGAEVASCPEGIITVPYASQYPAPSRTD